MVEAQLDGCTGLVRPEATGRPTVEGVVPGSNAVTDEDGGVEGRKDVGATWSNVSSLNAGPPAIRVSTT